ncbi:hypothetical protein [Haloferax sp. ATB1]|nr:hypothetical protein [Haloferax sp. ATB1]
MQVSRTVRLEARGSRPDRLAGADVSERPSTYRPPRSSCPPAAYFDP